MARYRQFSKPREKFPWLLFLGFLIVTYLFWGLPYQLGNKPISVSFETPK